MWWELKFNLTRNKRKRTFFHNQIKGTEAKIWQQQFLKFQIWQVRGELREKFDWLRERIDGAIRQMAEIKYTFIYSEGDNEVKVMDMPLPPRELEVLPDKATPPHRYHKVPKKDIDKTKLEELKRIVDRRQPDLDNMKTQLQQIDGQVNQIDITIEGLFELKKALHKMLKRL